MTNNRLLQLLDRRKTGLLSIFYTAGYPGVDDTMRIAEALQSAGADLIEIGIPFSDPVADGPVIQHSNQVALENGMTVARLLDQVKTLRKSVALPVILMGYINPVLQYGFEKFCKDSAAAGVDGLILPDLPLDEYDQHYRSMVEANGLVMTFLVSPTTSPDRIRRIDQLTGGFIYAVAASSTTGARKAFTEEQLAYFGRLRSMKLDHPILIGFGIGDAASFASACQYGAGAIVGSAFVTMLGASKSPAEDIRQFVHALRTPS